MNAQILVNSVQYNWKAVHWKEENSQIYCTPNRKNAVLSAVYLGFELRNLQEIRRYTARPTVNTAVFSAVYLADKLQNMQETLQYYCKLCPVDEMHPQLF